MFSPYTTTGFQFAPVSKLLLGGMFATSIAINIPLSSHRHLFTLHPEDFCAGKEVWKIITSKLAFIDAKDLLCAAMLIYNFRFFERRLGSRKFVGFLLSTTILSISLEAAVLLACQHLQIDLHNYPSGPLDVLFSMYVPFFCDIPRVAMTHVMGIPVTGKSLAYLVGLQMCSDSLEGVILASCGIIAGLLYRKNFLCVQDAFVVPKNIASLFYQTLGKLLESTPQNRQMPTGATIEIQQQQHMERLEQQLLMAQLRRHNGLQQGDGRNAEDFQPQLFENGNERPPPADPQPGPSQVQADETQVQLLTEMGFQRENVVNALQITNNNPSLATNILLQQS